MEILPRNIFRLQITLSLYYLIINLMKVNYVIALIALLAVNSLATDCPVDERKQSVIYSDSVGLTAQNNNNSNGQNLIYNYQFEKPLPATPSVALGLNQIEATQSPVLDLRVTNPKVTPTGVYFQAQSGEQSQWKNFKVNFMATTRNDMELGSVETRSPLINPNDNTFNMVYNMKKDLAQSGLKFDFFLQGINIQSRDKDRGKFGIRKQSASVSNRQAFFTFSTPLRSSIVRSLAISIVIFNMYTPGILYADGIIDQNYVISKTQVTIPKHGINQLRTYIVGINSFEISASKPVSIYSALTQTFQLQIGPIDRNQIDFVSVSYLILSIVDCGSCQGNPILFEGICQFSCPPGFKAYKGRCVPEKCEQGYILFKGECIAACRGPNEFYYSGTCVCKQDFYRIQGICQQCAQGSFYDYKLGRCRALCGINSVYRGGRCYCNPGFFVINNRCQQCTYGTVYDYNTQTCVSNCQNNQIFSPQGCVCKNGYNRINGVCSRCPYMRIYDPDLMQCVCNQGYQQVYGQCLPVCSKNQTRFQGTCVCAQGYYSVEGGCYKCAPGSVYSPAYLRCICMENYRQTPQGCVPNCRDNQRLVNDVCVDYCKLYQTLINGVCQCDQDSQRINGQCRPKCLVFQYRDANGKCRCIGGYYKGFNPLCQKVNCPAGTYFDEVRADCITVCKGANMVYVNGGCYCGYGFNSANPYGQCIRNCSVTQDNIRGLCECKPGLARIASGFCIDQASLPNYSQGCPPGTVRVFGMCINPSFCGVNQYWCGTGCQCVNGFYRINGQCVPVQPTVVCPFNSQSNGVSCVCKPGFYPITPGLCQPCPYGTYWDGKVCASTGLGLCIDGWYWNAAANCCVIRASCGLNEIWDGSNCRCQQGFFWIQRKCQRCPDNTVFDGYGCTAGFNNCRDPYSFWNGIACVCIPGYWPLFNGKCVSCPHDTVWDGTCCKPASGLFPVTVASWGL